MNNVLTLQNTKYKLLSELINESIFFDLHRKEQFLKLLIVILI